MKCNLFALIILFFCVSLNNVKAQSSNTDLFISDSQIINLAKAFIEEGNLSIAKSLLSKKTFFIKELEIERLFLIGRIFVLEKDYENAIEIFDFILEKDPTASRVRFELAIAYMQIKSWYSADYHLRLAASTDNLPPLISQDISKLLYTIRQNKNYNFAFSIGINPDNNINNSNSKEECVITIFGLLCRKLPDAEKVIGFNTSFSGEYEFRFKDNLRLKNVINLNNTKYDNKKYDNTYISFSSGPRFIYNTGDIYLSIITNRHWLGHRPYSYGSGLQLDLNYDFSNNLSGNLNILYSKSFYDENNFLNGINTSYNTSLSYNISSFINFIFKFGRHNENTKIKEYKNRNNNFAFGMNSELYYGFSIYLEPSVDFHKYYYSKVVVKNFQFVEITEQNRTEKYLLSISNKKLHFYKVMPVFRYWYIKRTSNVEQNEYRKHLFDITITHRF